MEEHSAEFDIAISYPTRANEISFIQFILILKSTSGDVNVTAWSKGRESVKKRQNLWRTDYFVSYEDVRKARETTFLISRKSTKNVLFCKQ